MKRPGTARAAGGRLPDKGQKFREKTGGGLRNEREGGASYRNPKETPHHHTQRKERDTGWGWCTPAGGLKGLR